MSPSQTLSHLLKSWNNPVHQINLWFIQAYTCIANENRVILFLWMLSLGSWDIISDSGPTSHPQTKDVSDSILQTRFCNYPLSTYYTSTGKYTKGMNCYIVIIMYLLLIVSDGIAHWLLGYFLNTGWVLLTLLALSTMKPGSMSEASSMPWVSILGLQSMPLGWASHNAQPCTCCPFTTQRHSQWNKASYWSRTYLDTLTFTFYQSKPVLHLTSNTQWPGNMVG